VQHGVGGFGESVWGGEFEDESFALTHDARGVLSMANTGKDTNRAQFFLLFGPQVIVSIATVKYSQSRPFRLQPPYLLCYILATAAAPQRQACGLRSGRGRPAYAGRRRGGGQHLGQHLSACGHHSVLCHTGPLHTVTEEVDEVVAPCETKLVVGHRHTSHRSAVGMAVGPGPPVTWRGLGLQAREVIL